METKVKTHRVSFLNEATNKFIIGFAQEIENGKFIIKTIHGFFEKPKPDFTIFNSFNFQKFAV